MPRGALMVCALLSGCSGGPAFLDSGGLGALILFAVDGAQVTAEAHPAGADAPPIERELVEGTDLYTYEYTDALDALGVAPGPLNLSTSGERLPEPLARHRLVDGEWSALASAPSVLGDLRLANRAVCGRYEARAYAIPIDADEYATFALALDAERVFLGTNKASFYVVRFDAVETVALSTTTPSMLGVRAGGELWLFGRDGATVHGDPDHGFVPGPPAPFPLQYGSAVDSARGAAPLEMFLVGAELEVAHFDGAAWTKIRDATGGAVDRSRITVAWSEPGRAFITGIAQQRMLEIDRVGGSSVIVMDVPPRANNDSLWAVGWVADVGLVVGTRNNVLFVRGDGVWTRLPFPIANPRPDVMIGLGGGRFVTGGENGIFVEWPPSGISCEPMIPATGGMTRAIAPITGGFVMVASGNASVLHAMAARRLPD